MNCHHWICTAGCDRCSCDDTLQQCPYYGDCVGCCDCADDQHTGPPARPTPRPARR